MFAVFTGHVFVQHLYDIGTFGMNFASLLVDLAANI